MFLHDIFTRLTTISIFFIKLIFVRVIKKLKLFLLDMLDIKTMYNALTI
jgi:hypothetical protein